MGAVERGDQRGCVRLLTLATLAGERELPAPTRPLDACDLPLSLFWIDRYAHGLAPEVISKLADRVTDAAEATALGVIASDVLERSDALLAAFDQLQVRSQVAVEERVRALDQRREP